MHTAQFRPIVIATVLVLQTAVVLTAGRRADPFPVGIVTVFIAASDIPEETRCAGQIAGERVLLGTLPTIGFARAQIPLFAVLTLRRSVVVVAEQPFPAIGIVMAQLRFVTGLAPGSGRRAVVQLFVFALFFHSFTVMVVAEQVVGALGIFGADAPFRPAPQLLAFSPVRLAGIDGHVTVVSGITIVVGGAHDGQTLVRRFPRHLLRFIAAAGPRTTRTNRYRHQQHQPSLHCLHLNQSGCRPHADSYLPCFTFAVRHLQPNPNEGSFGKGTLFSR